MTHFGGVRQAPARPQWGDSQFTTGETSMKFKKVAVALALGMSLSAVPAVPAVAHTTGIHDNCTKLQTRWPHGVGTRRAVDKTTGTPVTTFRRNNDAYWRAMRHNSTLDRDRDRIACEKA